jgi:L-ribulokinase
VVGGAYPNAEAAQAKMVEPATTVYAPDPYAANIYAELFEVYKTLHDGFGGVSSLDMGGVMKRLINIRDRSRNA